MLILLPLSQYKKQALRQEKIDLAGYPKELKLRDGTQVILRPMKKGDGEKLLEFFNNLQPRAKLFLKDDVSDPKVIQDWEDNLDFSRTIPILAFQDDKIIGNATLHRNSRGWARHVGEIRIVTAHEYRRKGLGYLLTREIFFIAQKLRVDMVMAQVMSIQEDAISVFEKLGFTKEAVLKNAVMDMKNKKHDLVILTQDISVLWQQIENLISDMEDHGG